MNTPRRTTPRQARSIETRELLLDAASKLISEVGIDRASTNLICARAGLTPPALYRYFEDKYAVFGALGRRVFAEQEKIIQDWLDRHEGLAFQALIDDVDELVRATQKWASQTPRAIQTVLALGAIPQLAELRREAGLAMADRLLSAFAPPRDSSREAFRTCVRLAFEFNLTLAEMLENEAGPCRSDLRNQGTAVLRSILTMAPMETEAQSD